MQTATAKLPEKRTEILYSRITLKNKSYLSKAAREKDVSESVLVNHILDTFRQTNAGNKRKSGRGGKKAG